MGAHPNNPNNRHTAAKPPSLEDILCNKNNKSASLPQRFGAATAGAAAAAKTKAKRHLVHDKAGQDAGVDEAVKIKEAPTLKVSLRSSFFSCSPFFIAARDATLETLHFRLDVEMFSLFFNSDRFYWRFSVVSLPYPLLIR